MRGHAIQSVERYCELAHKEVSSLKSVATPCIDNHLLSPEDFTCTGEVADVAARIVLKALYLARNNRLDSLWAVSSLARDVTKWSAARDKRLHRMISYLYHQDDKVQVQWVGGPVDDCTLHLFVDASFARDLQDSQSTSGAIFVFLGPNTWVPITWLCKNQGAVSHSSTEAEVIALEASLRTEGIAAVIFGELITEVFCKKNVVANKTIIPKPVMEKRMSIIEYLSNVDYVPCDLPEPKYITETIVMEDNGAVMKMTMKGRSPAMRHVARTHRIDLDWVYERFFNDPGIQIRYIKTKFQIADILTKGSFTSELWARLLIFSGIVSNRISHPKKAKTSEGEIIENKNLVQAKCAETNINARSSSNQASLNPPVIMSSSSSDVTSAGGNMVGSGKTAFLCRKSLPGEEQSSDLVASKGSSGSQKHVQDPEIHHSMPGLEQVSKDNGYRWTICLMDVIEALSNVGDSSAMSQLAVDSYLGSEYQSPWEFIKGICAHYADLGVLDGKPLNWISE